VVRRASTVTIPLDENQQESPRSRETHVLFEAGLTFPEFDQPYGAGDGRSRPYATLVWFDQFRRIFKSANLIAESCLHRRLA
jgi:hypothetical protein